MGLNDSFAQIRG
jgi:hypothetical protein